MVPTVVCHILVTNKFDMNKRKKGFSSVVVAILVAVIVAGGVLMFSFSSSPSETRPPQQPASSSANQTDPNSNISTSSRSQDSGWKQKLDANLARLIDDDMNSPIEPARMNDSGEEVYGVFVRTGQPQKLRDAGIDINSVSGDIVTARFTESEIIQAAKLQSVSRVNSSGSAYPTEGQAQPL